MKSYRTMGLAVWLLASVPVVGAEHDDMALKLDQYVKNAVKKGIPGASLAVVINGDIRLLRGYGVTKKGSKEKIDSATVFPLASISKTFASAAVSILVDQGVIEWDTHVVPYLDNITFSDPMLGKDVTLRHLLSHTTGLVPQAYSDLIEDNVKYSRILNILDRVKFVCEPGKCYGYQNVVYNLTADMLALAVGVDYSAFVQENIFVPLEMDHASYGMEGFTESENRVTPHVKVKAGFAPVKPASYYYRLPAAAGVNASAQDLAKWMLAQLGHNPSVLRPPLLEIMHKPHIRANQYRYRAKLSNVYYGLGWRTFDYKGISGFVHHGGWIKGIRTEMLFNRHTQTGMVFLTNCETDVARDIVLYFLKLYRERFEQQKS
ncbi:serine hydrolase [Photobacterium gaetbulicola]|uniref:Beta-lactamase-like protein n=1 Tax=Photobacterium gaetbulicola Gung47 TaxID=658445 RepID=A0A0C5WHQ1_9GAMM|nr:serine hydrolase domain-containing protein [Photobacterium gaetbulicola]AJR05697.1 beta-lactamase-like protein [Photobacterium gaetbulicola Gung47]PSU14666.1 serine hydrolase [Photobacterium gaetbulicola]